MNRRTKIIGGGAITAAALAGIAVPAYAAAAAPGAAPAISIPGANVSTKATPPGLEQLSAIPAQIAKDAGTDTAGLKAGLEAGKSLTQIAASHQVSRATLLTRLDARADAYLPKLINTAVPAGALTGGMSGMTSMPSMPSMPGTAGRGGDTGPGMGAAGMASRLGLVSAFTSVATTLKLSPMELVTEVMKGQTLQQIATKQKVSTSTLLGALDKQVNAAIAKVVDLAPHAKKAATAPSA